MKVTRRVDVIGTVRVKIIHDKLLPRKRKVAENKKRCCSKSEQYVCDVIGGGGDYAFKNWLLSRPMDRYLIKPC